MFSHSHQEEIWLLRATQACKTLSHCLTTLAELSEKKQMEALIHYLFIYSPLRRRNKFPC